MNNVIIESMLSLFDDQPLLPQGFSYYPSFLTAEEEQLLLIEIANLELKNMQFHEYEAKRRTAGFGMGWSFENRLLQKGKDIPTGFRFLVEKVTGKLSIDPFAVAAMLVTEYPIDAVINWHRDAPPYDKIIGISLSSDGLFRFRPYDKQLQGRRSIISLPVARRSLYLMDGASRSEWEHSTAPAKKMRYSITLRTLK